MTFMIFSTIKTNTLIKISLVITLPVLYLCFNLSIKSAIFPVLFFPIQNHENPEEHSPQMGKMGHIVTGTIGNAECQFQQSVPYHKPLRFNGKGKGDDE